MVAKLTKEYVEYICKKRDFELITYEHSRKKISVNCKNCNRNPQKYWWAQIRDGQSCRYCSGARVDILEPFKRHGLRPLTKPSNWKEKVQVECIKCSVLLPEKASYDKLSDLKDTPCWLCNTYQVEWRNLFREKGWELYERYVSKDYYSVQCNVCGHWSNIHAGTVKKWSANCPVCRDIRMYRLIGARLESLDGVLTGPLDLGDLKRRTPAFCNKCQTQGSLVFKDVVYGLQGFCKPCAIASRSEKRRRYDYLDHLDRLSLEYIRGEYVNEDSIIHYKCKDCGLPDCTTVYMLRTREKGCIFCDGKKLSEDPLALFREKGFIPLESFKGHQTPLPCLCPRCKQLCRPTRLNLQQGHFGCTCILEDNPGVYNESFFEKNSQLRLATGGIYLIQFIDENEVEFFKIGIHLVRTNRVGVHERQGGKCVQYAIASLYECWVVEQLILEKLSSFSYSPKMVLRGGSTECLRIAELSIESFWNEAFQQVPAYFVEAKENAEKILNGIYPDLKTLPEMPIAVSDIS